MSRMGPSHDGSGPALLEQPVLFAQLGHTWKAKPRPWIRNALVQTEHRGQKVKSPSDCERRGKAWTCRASSWDMLQAKPCLGFVKVHQEPSGCGLGVPCP